MQRLKHTFLRHVPQIEDFLSSQTQDQVSTYGSNKPFLYSGPGQLLWLCLLTYRLNEISLRHKSHVEKTSSLRSTSLIGAKLQISGPNVSLLDNAV